MKLDKLTIKEFKNLRDFAIDFDQDRTTTVVVGRNGSGKSNLLEALIIIFRDLDLGQRPTFAYQLDYICRKHRVHIDADPARTKDAMHVWVEGEQWAPKLLTESDAGRLLPSNVFAYYSGSSNRMEVHFRTHERNYYRHILRHGDQPLRPLFYAQLVHAQFALLAFFTDGDAEIFRFLRENLRIEGLDSVLFVMKQPPWKSSSGDARFWNADGVVRHILTDLYDRALAPVRLRKRVESTFRNFKNLEYLYLYLPDVAALRSLAKSYTSQQDFFKALESTFISDLISEVRIRVIVRGVDGSLMFRDLSEGEQQLIMVLGLLRFTQEEETLFLLDEPDTHLNPLWSVRYIEFLQHVMGEHPTSHVIMTTHDPLVLLGLERSQIQIMERNEDSGRVMATIPDLSPKGMGVEAVLTSEVFGLPSALDLETQRLLEEWQSLASAPELNDEQRNRLGVLTGQVEALGLT